MQLANKLKEKEEVVFMTYSLEHNQLRSYVGLRQHSVYKVDNVQSESRIARADSAPTLMRTTLHRCLRTGL